MPKKNETTKKERKPSFEFKEREWTKKRCEQALKNIKKKQEKFYKDHEGDIKTLRHLFKECSTFSSEEGFSLEGIMMNSKCIEKMAWDLNLKMGSIKRKEKQIEECLGKCSLKLSEYNSANTYYDDILHDYCEGDLRNNWGYSQAYKEENPDEE